MAIKKIVLENFTVFTNIELNFCDGVNVIIGENGTGKTHLLKLLYALCNYEYNETALKEDFHERFKEELFKVFPGDDDIKLIRNHEYNQNINVNILNELPKAVLKISFVSNNKKHNLTLLFHMYRYNEINPSHGNARKKKMKIPAIFIPAKDMLSHAGLEKDFAERNLPFDASHIDILNKAGVSTLKNIDKSMHTIMTGISEIIGGRIVYKYDKYFVEKHNGMTVEFAMEAEGFKKLGTLYRLIDTGYLKKGHVLIWDEPEANLNPKMIPVVVDILLKLAGSGVQIFLATHDYNLMKYFSVKNADDQVVFISLYKTDNGVASEIENDYNLLEHNAIVEANIKLLEDDIDGVL